MKCAPNCWRAFRKPIGWLNIGFRTHQKEKLINTHVTTMDILNQLRITKHELKRSENPCCSCSFYFIRKWYSWLISKNELEKWIIYDINKVSKHFVLSKYSKLYGPLLCTQWSFLLPLSRWSPFHSSSCYTFVSQVEAHIYL